MQWMFSTYKPDDTQRDSVSGEFFSNTRLESVIREAIQNSLDARVDKSKAAEVRIYYSGPTCAVPGAEYAALYRGQSVNDHYTHPNSGLENVPAEGDACAFLTIEDFGTSGLTGDVTLRPTEEELENDRIKGNYYNFFFRENRSDKAGDGALGSWGAGKIMFMKASRLRTAFTLSVRKDETVPRFLAGRTVLKSHSINDVTYAPDGWFGVDAGASDAPRYMRKRPVTEKSVLDDFAKRFKLERKEHECGTSIVIPYLDVEEEESGDVFTKENIARAVLKNFMVAILGGDLEVKVATGTDAEPILISQKTVDKAKKYLPISPDATEFVTRAHYNLAALPPGPGCEFTLKHVSPNLKPVWVDEMFAGLDLKAIKKLLLAGQALRFNVPMTVLEKTSDSAKQAKKGGFTVMIARTEDPASYRTAFYRIGLLIDAASTRSFAGYASLVTIPQNDTAKLLVASEPPSHSKWEGTSERARKSYHRPGKHIEFVVTAVREILSRIQAADQEPDKNVLIGPFGIPKDEKDESGQKKPEKKPEKSEGAKPGDEESKTHGEIPEALLVLSKQQGKTGFSISMKADRVSDKGYPFVAPYKMGYAPFTSSSWSKFDFQLEDASTITIALEKPEQAEIVEWKAEGNRLTLTVKKQGAFRLYVTGFDPNRDLEVMKQRYVYPNEKAEG